MSIKISMAFYLFIFFFCLEQVLVGFQASALKVSLPSADTRWQAAIGHWCLQILRWWQRRGDSTYFWNTLGLFFFLNDPFFLSTAVHLMPHECGARPWYRSTQQSVHFCQREASVDSFCIDGCQVNHPGIIFIKVAFSWRQRLPVWVLSKRHRTKS